jgi:membrane protein
VRSQKATKREQGVRRKPSARVARSALRVAGFALLALSGRARASRRLTRSGRVHEETVPRVEPAMRVEVDAPALQPLPGAAPVEPAAATVPPAKGIWPLLKDTMSAWSNHKASRLGAALAYYSIFSLGPLMVVAITIAGLVFGADAVRGEVAGQLKGLLGDTGAKGIEAMLAGAGNTEEGIFASAVGIATLVFAATGVVVQLKDALNTVWDVKTAKSSGVWQFARTYVVSIAGVLSVGFLLLMSLLLTTALAAAGKYLAPYLPEAALQVVGFACSFAIIAVLFAMMFKWLPDTPIGWRDVWLGAVVTAALFEAGKFLIGLYIGKQGLESTFGAAASIVVVLIWVYYSAQILLLGAEFTRVYACRYGSRRNVALA